MRRETITIRTNRGQQHDVSGYVRGPALAVHRTVSWPPGGGTPATGKRWVVTHRASGLRLGRGFPSRAAAFRAAARIDAECTLCTTKALSPVVSEAAAAYDVTAVRAVSESEGGR